MLIGSIQMNRAVCADDDTGCTSLINDLLNIILDFFLCTGADQVSVVVAEAADNALVVEQLLAFCNRNLFRMNSPVDYAAVIICVNRPGCLSFLSIRRYEAGCPLHRNLPLR